jgi:uncharacterized protein involved in exopolysaccharide biosynthesis
VSAEKFEDDAFELIDYLQVIWKRKVLVALGTLAFVGGGVLVSFTSPKLYEASVTFLLEESKISTKAISRGFGPKVVEMHLHTYDRIIKNRKLANQAITHFRLDQEPYNLKVADLYNAISINIPRGSKIIRMAVQFPDPE